MVHVGRPFKVLSIDGGGYCSLSGILTVKHLLAAAAERETSEHSPRPCEHFDLICGVGSGGLVAILFGRLGMRCDEALEAYESLGRLSFQEEELDRRLVVSPREPTRLSMRAELERLTQLHCGTKDAMMKPDAGSKRVCRVSEASCSSSRVLTPIYADICSCIVKCW